MIRFFANRYTREEITNLRKAIWTGYTALTTNGHNCKRPCAECRHYHPCYDLSKFLKRLDEILAIPEEVQK